MKTNAFSARPLLITAGIALLILLFAYAAVSKLLDFEAFRAQLYNQNIPRGVAGPLAWALPAAELLTCGLLWSRRGQAWGLRLSLAMLTTFTVYTGLVLMGFWDRVPCSCGGILSHMSWGFHLGFNIFFLALTVALLWAADEPAIPARRQPSGSGLPE